ncbi:MAG: hypothetical protein RBU21_01005 [FCB group bacterium]|jgi:hypothetical protein|nr:hypothetical protein [FCB group bacterium]
MRLAQRGFILLCLSILALPVWGEPLPTLDELAGEWCALQPLEQMPAVSNFHGAISATRNVLGIADFTQPPLSLGGPTAELNLDDEPLLATESRWCAYQIQRRAARGVLVETTVRMVPEAGGVLFRLQLTNPGAAEAVPRIDINLSGRIRRYDSAWEWFYPRPGDPAEFEAEVLATPPKVLVVRDALSPARTAWAFAAVPDILVAAEHDGTVAWRPAIQPGATVTLEFVMAAASDEAEAVASATKWTAAFAETFESARTHWQARFHAAFTPDNGHFSGSLPALHFDDPALRRVYYVSVLSFLSMERTNFGPRFPRVFVTCAPRYAATMTYFWDCIAYSTLWSRLDPVSVREQIKLFLQADVHRCYAIDFLTLKGVGPWYGANDYAIFHLCNTYLNETGDWAFLDERIGEKTVADLMEEFSLHWKKFVSGASGLANYGTKDNLLETVPTYLQRVASFNAANVWMMRIMADIRTRQGQFDKAGELRAQADALAREVLSLYVPGKGYWTCLMDDGSRVEVRHCIDYFTVGRCMFGDLTDTMKNEMTVFVERELVSGNWLRALSLEDAAAKDSPRADHGYTGAYDAWPALTIETFAQMGHTDKAFAMLRRAAEITAEGCFGQSHYVATDGKPARKAAEGGQDYFEGCGGGFAEVMLRANLGIAN